MLRVLSVLLLMISFASAAQDEFDPARLRTWSRGAVNVLETYEAYKESFALHRPKRYDSLTRSLVDRENAFFLMAEFNPLTPSIGSESTLNGARVRTTEGPLDGSVQKSNGALHASFRASEWEAGGYAILDMLDLFFTGDNNDSLAHVFKGLDENEPIGFSAGFILSAAYLKWKDIEVNAGSVHRFLPLTTRDSTGRETFHLKPAADSTYSGTETRKGVFLDLRKGGYAINTLFSARETFESLGIGLPAFPWRDFTVEPFIRHARFRSRTQAGAEFRKRLTWSSIASLEAAGDVHRNSAGRFEAFHHLVLGNTWTGRALPRDRLHAFRRYDYKVLVDTDLSVSSDAVDETAWGAAGAITFQDILGLLSFRIGVGYNDYRHLRLFPVRDVVAMDLMLRVAW